MPQILRHYLKTDKSEDEVVLLAITTINRSKCDRAATPYTDEQKDETIGTIEGQEKFYGTECRSGFTEASVWIAYAGDLRGW
ncbi:MAG: hypothetical protein WBB28_11320 [Crinalium sp.]